MKVNKRNIVLSLIACTCLAPVSGQHIYTLDECINSALKYNVKVRNAENDLEMAKHDKKEAFTKYFPNISAVGSGFIANEPLVQMQMSPEAKMEMLKDGMLGGISATMPLFTGGQIVNGNKLAELGVNMKALQKKQTDDEVRLEVERYFWQIVMLKEKLKTISLVEKQLERLETDVQASVDAGIVTRNDLLQVQLKKNDVLSGKIQLENSLNVSLSLLGQYIGAKSDSIDVAFVVEEHLSESPQTLFCNHTDAVERTNEYGLLKQNLQASKLQYKMAVGKNLPTVAIGGGLVYDNFVMGQDQSFYMGFVTVSVPISGWWGGTHSIKKHKLQVKNAENLLNDNSEMLVIRMQNVWNTLNDSYRKAEIALLSVEQSSENLRLNMDYYSAGTAAMSELLDAQTLYQQSRDKYVEAYTNYELSKREYLQATGR
ncbi:TolC family protein [Phocaeicola sp. KGMB11183]|uniref:TolC family protein n=1 Tax=Phocaeicola acetigenes TaxID=3016083 RepID=A0ABT4PJC8_9BACT|nr:TolC family protein [Phocaeicola sp. KGMB11183]MCZ8373160.1 TolC family protein [Phocaeicola sp. KGMB11183]